MKAIDTYYKGYRFRSRLEARWAVFLDAIGLQWEYELQGFNLDGLLYLPDFWLPQVEMWAEVKPIAFTKQELKKTTLLMEQSGFPVLWLVGTPENQPYWASDGYDYCLSIDSK